MSIADSGFVAHIQPGGTRFRYVQRLSPKPHSLGDVATAQLHAFEARGDA